MKVLEDVHRQLEELGQHGRHTYNNEPVEVRSKRQLMVRHTDSRFLSVRDIAA